jgi:pyruvate/2-oxoglutarate dehydrogenase complex dihydrolipoamide acyltransferase (E2) component
LPKYACHSIRFAILVDKLFFSIRAEQMASKATLNLSTPAAGFVHFLVEAGQEVPNGTVLALVAQDTADFAAYQARPAAAAQNTTPPPVMPPAPEAYQELRLTKAAEGLLSSKGISAAKARQWVTSNREEDDRHPPGLDSSSSLELIPNRREVHP